MKKFFLIFALFSFSAFAAPHPSIIGGVEEPSGSPIARSTVLLKGKIARASFKCTASILAPDLLITAGHCLGGPGYATLTASFRTREDAPGPEIAVIKQVRIEETIPQRDLDWNDIAVLKLASPIPAGYEPIHFLEDPSLLQVGTSVVLAGYGRNVSAPPTSGEGGAGVLRSVTQKILEVPYGEKEILIDLSGGKGSCHGDSGGPAFLEIGDKLYYFGTTSRLTEKDRLPNTGRIPQYGCSVDMVYSNALMQRDWIEKTMEEIRK